MNVDERIASLMRGGPLPDEWDRIAGVASDRAARAGTARTQDHYNQVRAECLRRAAVIRAQWAEQIAARVARERSKNERLAALSAAKKIEASDARAAYVAQVTAMVVDAVPVALVILDALDYPDRLASFLADREEPARIARIEVGATSITIDRVPSSALITYLAGLAVDKYRVEFPRSRGEQGWIYAASPRRNTGTHSCRYCREMIDRDAHLGEVAAEVRDHTLRCGLQYLVGLRSAVLRST